VTLPRQEPGHFSLKRQLQLPFISFLLVLYIGENFLFVQADAGHTVATGPDAFSGKKAFRRKGDFALNAFADSDFIYCNTRATVYFGGITITM